MATTTVFASPASRTSILTARNCTKKITWVKKRFEASDYAKPTPYHKQILELTRTFENPDTKSRVKQIFAGLPCYHCSKLITIGSKYFSRRGAIYHLSCAKGVHLI